MHPYECSLKVFYVCVLILRCVPQGESGPRGPSGNPGARAVAVSRCVLCLCLCLCLCCDVVQTPLDIDPLFRCGALV